MIIGKIILELFPVASYFHADFFQGKGLMVTYWLEGAQLEVSKS